MPRQGQSVESCIIGKWHIQKGDNVSTGDVLFTYETDKATFEEEAKVDGIVLELFFDEGDDVECLTNVCVIGNEGESVEEYRPFETADSKQQTAAADGGNILVERSPTPSVAIYRPPSAVVNISPRAKILVKKTNADIRSAVPTGANNRIMESDIQRVLDSGRFAPHLADTPCNAAVDKDFEEVPMSNIRKVIAKSMHASLANSAQLTLHSSFNATNLIEFRKKLKSEPSMPNITITDVMVYIVSRVLLEHRSLNAHWADDRMLLFRNAHIGVAVDTPRGLLVPTIFNANKMTLPELSEHTKTLFDRAKQGAITPDLLRGATFTITNLGTLGIEMFTPVLNPPQVGILGVNSIVERTKEGKPYPAMGLSLTFDHRALDGADAARFLKNLVGSLEESSL